MSLTPYPHHPSAAGRGRTGCATTLLHENEERAYPRSDQIVLRGCAGRSHCDVSSEFPCARTNQPQPGRPQPGPEGFRTSTSVTVRRFFRSIPTLSAEAPAPCGLSFHLDSCYVACAVSSGGPSVISVGKPNIPED